MPRLLPAIAACAIFLGAYVLIATEKWATRTAATLGGAALVLALGISDAEAAFSEETGVDWNVVFLLLGMMIIVSVMRETGVFEYLATEPADSGQSREMASNVTLMAPHGTATCRVGGRCDLRCPREALSEHRQVTWPCQRTRCAEVIAFATTPGESMPPATSEVGA